MSVNDFDPQIMLSAQQANIDPRLLRAVLTVESNGNPGAVNASTGATGLGQQIPDTAQRLGINPNDPNQSIDGAARLLAENMKRYGNVDDAVRAYHGGTDQANWGPKTQAYVGKVAQAFQNTGAQTQQSFDDPVDQLLAKQAGGASASDPVDQLLASKATEQAAPMAANVSRGTPLASASDRYRSTLSPDRQQDYDKLLSDLRWQANFIQAGPNPGLGDKLMGGAWRGISDAADFLTGGAGFVGNRLGLVKDETMDDYMHAIQQINDEYTQSRQAATQQGIGNLVSGQKATPGTDWGRLIGQGLAGGGVGKGLEGAGALAARAGGLGATEGSTGLLSTLTSDLANSRLGRLAQNAFTGGTAGAVASPQSDASLGSQTAMGAGIGAILPPIASKVAGAIASPFARALSRAPIPAGQVAQDTSQALQSAAGSVMNAVGKDANGNVAIDTSKLPDAVQSALKGPLKNLTPEQQARVLTYESLGIKDYTLADVTRNAADAMTERNLAQNAKLGTPIRTADVAKNQQLAQAAQRAVDLTGQSPTDNQALGQSIRSHLQDQLGQFNDRIKEAYGQADAAAAGAPQVSARPIVNTLSSNRSKFLASSDGLGLLNGIRGRLQEFTGNTGGAQGKPLIQAPNGQALLTDADIPKKMTFQDSEAFRQYLNDVSTPDNYPLVKAVKNAVDMAQDNAGQGAGDIYKAARALRQQRSQMFENQGGVAKILASSPGGDARLPVDKIMDNYVFNKGNSDQLTQLIGQLNKGGQAGQDILNQLRASTMQNAITNSISKVPGETGGGAISGPALKAQFDKIGSSKMASLFTPEQQNYLGALQRGAVDLTTSPPVRNAYNPSGTAAQGINALDALAAMPGQPSSVGALIAKGIGHVPYVGAPFKAISELGAQARERAASGIEAQRAALSAKPLQTLTAAQQKMQQDQLRQAIAARLMGNPAALGGALQPSN